MNKQPQITEKTKGNFISAFWQMLTMAPLSKITVSSIVKKAGYNRSTFYEYFSDINELVDCAENELICEIKSLLSFAIENEKQNSFFIASRILFEKYSNKIFLLLSSGGDPVFADKIKDVFNTVILNSMNLPEDIENTDYLLAYTSSAMLGLMQHWHKMGKNLSQEEFISLSQSLLANGTKGFLGDKLTELFHI